MQHPARTMARTMARQVANSSAHATPLVRSYAGSLWQRQRSNRLSSHERTSAVSPAYEECATSAASGGARQQLQTVAGRAPAVCAVPPQLCVASQFWCMLARPAHGPAVPASVVLRRHRSSAPTKSCDIGLHNRNSTHAGRGTGGCWVTSQRRLVTVTVTTALRQRHADKR